MRPARLFVVASALAACAEPAPSPTTPTPAALIPANLPASVPLEQFLTVSTGVDCARYLRCDRGNFAPQRAVFGTWERCVEHQDEMPSAPGREQLRRLVAMGVVRYDGEAARRCLEALRVDVCAAREPADCAAIVRGTVAPGGVCRFSAQCEGDAWCDLYTDAGFACPGRCVARTPAGGACRGDSEACSQAGVAGPVACEYEPSLSGTRFPYRCRDTGADVPAGFGEVCIDFRASGERRMRPCAAGTECRDAVDARGVPQGYRTCQGPARLGERCTSRCESDALCEFDGTRFEQRCLPLQVRNREGDSCVQGNQGTEFCNVLLGLDCVAGRCLRVGTGREGSVCFTSRFDFDSCAPGLYCQSSTQTCARRKPDGAPCSAQEECESRACVTAPGARQATCGVTLGCTPTR